MSLFKNLIFTLVFCAVVIACMASTMLVYNNAQQFSGSNDLAGTSLASANYVEGSQHLAILLRQKMM